MSVSNNQLKQFVEQIFSKHSTNNKDILTTSQLYGFFSNFIKGSKQVSLPNVQKTLQLVKTVEQDKITKTEMYDILKMILEKKKQRKEEIKQKKQTGQEQEIVKDKQKDRVALSLDIQNTGGRKANRQQSLSKQQGSVNKQMNINNVNNMNMNPYGLPNRFIAEQRLKNQFVSPHRIYPYAGQNRANLLTFR